ncbi:MAG: EamA family transporter [Eubacterium sp.]|nr:EamA family transporter [Eubacterium sp.]
MAQQQKSSLLKKPFIVCIIAVFCCALWGSAFPVIKIGYEHFNIEAADYASQILFAGVRFTFAGVLTVLFASVAGRKILIQKKESAGKVFILSLFQTVLQYIFFYVGLARTSGAKSSILDSMSVFFSVLIVTLILKTERFTVKKAIGCLLGFAGVVIINLTTSSFGTGFSFFGEGFILLSALSYSVSSVLIKRFSQSENPVILSGYQFALGGVILTAFGLILGGKLTTISAVGVMIILYLSLLSALAYTLWSLILKYNEVSSVTVYSFMIPVFGCILSALMLKESLSTSLFVTILALLLVSTGIFLVNKKEKLKSENSYES